MNAESWILLAGVVAPIVGALLAWLIYIERRMLTREEHERLCLETRTQMTEKLDHILERIKSAEQTAQESRHLVANSLHELSLKVAVLADRAGVYR
jgi:hypothetical protein